MARDLAPADVLHLKDRADLDLAGFVTELGGPTSHTAILARSLGLPAIVGADGARDLIEEDEVVVIDADADLIVVSPSRRRAARVPSPPRAHRPSSGCSCASSKASLRARRDGIAIDLLANIELPEDARDALEAGADGIGLFRSEFLFMDRDELPSEDEQFEAYAKVARAMKGKPVVIRTLDIGADKVLTEAARESLGMGRGAPRPESNPALGLRAIRYCLAYPELFLTQLRAILRASESGHGAHPDPDARACARDRAGRRLRRPREGRVEGAKAEVRRPHPAGRHDRGARRGAVAARVRASGSSSCRSAPTT